MRNTSIEAYRVIVEKGLLSKSRLAIYSVLFDHGPLTQTEVEDRLIDRTGNERKSRSGHKRFSELERQGAIAIVGERPCRVTGMNCKVWDVTERIPEPLPRPKPMRVQLAEALKELAWMRIENQSLKTELENLTKNSQPLP